jgi:hypothetical protein
MKGDKKSGMMGGMMADKGGMGCPMMAKMKEAKDMSGCCCSGMGGPGPAKKPAKS